MANVSASLFTACTAIVLVLASLVNCEMERDRRQFFDSLGGMALGDKRASPTGYSFDSLGGMALGDDKRSQGAVYPGAFFHESRIPNYIRQLKGSDAKRIVDSLAGDYLIKKRSAA